VIPVYDDAGNLIATHEHKASSKNGGAPPLLLIIQDRLRCRFAQFKLRTRFLYALRGLANIASPRKKTIRLNPALTVEAAAWDAASV
jgi:hypothetical protein